MHFPLAILTSHPNSCNRYRPLRDLAARTCRSCYISPPSHKDSLDYLFVPLHSCFPSLAFLFFSSSSTRQPPHSFHPQQLHSLSSIKYLHSFTSITFPKSITTIFKPNTSRTTSPISRQENALKSPTSNQPNRTLHQSQSKKKKKCAAQPSPSLSSPSSPQPKSPKSSTAKSKLPPPPPLPP